MLVAGRRNLVARDLNSIVRKEPIMGSLLKVVAKAEREKSQTDIGAGSQNAFPEENSGRSELLNSPENTDATTQKGSEKTSPPSLSTILSVKASLVAGACSDFQKAGGLITVRQVRSRQPSGRDHNVLILVMGVEDMDTNYLVADGDFEVLPP